MAEFYAFRIMNGQTTFDKVPRVLAARVSEILSEAGCGYLAER